MSDEMEDARFDMILAGIEAQNMRDLAMAKSDLYNRGEVAPAARMEAYQQLISLITPYVDFNFDDDGDDEQSILTAEEERRKFLEEFKKVDWEKAKDLFVRDKKSK